MKANRSRVIILTKHEVQCGSDRQKNAEGLILQLPNDHDGRNTWLLNYGVSVEAQGLRANRDTPVIWNEKTHAAHTISG